MAAVAWAIICSKRAVSDGELIETGAKAVDAFSQLLDFALAGENAARLRLVAAGHHMPAAEDVAVERDDRERNQWRDAGGRVERLGDQSAAQHRLDRPREWPADANHALEWNRPCRHVVTNAGAVSGIAGPSDDEAAPAGIFLANQLQPGRHVIESLDQHVLQQIAQAGLDGALVARLDLDEVCQRTHLTDATVGADQHEPCGVGETRAMRIDLFQRTQARGRRRQFLLARSHIALAPFVLDAGARQLRLAGRARDARRIQPVLRALQRI